MSLRVSRVRIVALVALLAVFVLLASMISPSAGASAGFVGSDVVEPPGEEGEDQSLDARPGRLEPTARQQALADQLDAQVSWNDFGTPHTLVSQQDSDLGGGLPGDAVEAARAWVSQNRELFRLSPEGVENLEVLNDNQIGEGNAVLFRQRFDGLEAGHDGLLTVAVRDGAVIYATSSIAGDDDTVPAARLSEQEAVRLAANDVGREIAPADIDSVEEGEDWTEVTVEGFTHAQHVKLVALPTPLDGVRPAYMVVLLDNEAADPLGVTSYVDAQTGRVWLREDLVDHQTEPEPEPEPAPDEEARWRVFPASPPLDYSSTDTRELWCWTAFLPECARALANDAARVPWDVIPGVGPTYTTNGNAALAVEKWNTNNPFAVGDRTATPRPDRAYDYPWTNQWYESGCDPDVFYTEQENDIDAAMANLHAMHNRMHDWSYFLGFTERNYNLQRHNFGLGAGENDPEQGNAQAGGIVGGPPNFQSRNNANQITPPDGVAPITNMYLWQPRAGSFYAPCVDGDYDMTVIAHEYTHAISNRMVAGPNAGLSGLQARAMGESWSDFVALEYLHEYGFVPVADENPWAVGPYVTSNKQEGIRNYGINASPLNYSDVGYDLVGPQVHADSQIWSATNFQIRQAMVRRYNADFPASDLDLQQRCADGELPAASCPGNRRWMQLTFDSLLLLPSNPTMLTARDAVLIADRLRFGGDNLDLLWNEFAARGMGETASSPSTADTDPIPGFSSPFETEATVQFRPVDPSGEPVADAELFVGDYEARVTPVADTRTDTARPDQLQMVAGTYEFLVRAPGRGVARMTAVVRAGSTRELEVILPLNLASRTNGATASGDGTGHVNLIDDTEATNWSSLNAPVEGRQVTVRLAPDGPHDVRRVQVSAMLVPGQNRFSALRQFRILTCLERSGVDCTQDDHYTEVLESAAAAFPADRPRPTAPDLITRSFQVDASRATHVRLQVVTNQCTGNPGYAGEQDNDPRADTDCASASTQDTIVRAAELQVFGRR